MLAASDYCSSNDGSPRAVTMQVIAANPPKMAGLRNGSIVNKMAATDHAVPSHRYAAIQKFPLLAKKVTEVIAAEHG